MRIAKLVVWLHRQTEAPPSVELVEHPSEDQPPVPLL